MILSIALLLEWLFGDPDSRWHPVAWFGYLARRNESLFYADNRKSGFVCWCFTVLVALLPVLILHALFGGLFDIVLLWICMGWNSLFTHVRAVLEAATPARARDAVSRIVSRDTMSMDMTDTRRAALESLAENASDAVVAPLFWFVFLGPVGVALYRMINTLDAMWAYRSKRYLNFGWWTAVIDDLANWFPARITARLILWSGKNPARWQDIRSQARTHASPNAGYPEVALAYAADVRLGGSVIRGGVMEYRPDYGPERAKEPDHERAMYALEVVRRSLLMAAALALGVCFVI